LRIDYDSVKPVYLQIAEAIEDDILSGKLKENEQAYSQLVLAKSLKVNPATAAKGINVLVAKGILAKQRGYSMAVAPGAYERLRGERLNRRLNALIAELADEAAKLGLNEEDIHAAIRMYFKEESTE
jgi:DNA-binding transcriptional regulator YhcF (GntR family)